MQVLVAALLGGFSLGQVSCSWGGLREAGDERGHRSRSDSGRSRRADLCLRLQASRWGRCGAGGNFGERQGSSAGVRTVPADCVTGLIDGTCAGRQLGANRTGVQLSANEMGLKG